MNTPPPAPPAPAVADASSPAPPASSPPPCCSPAAAAPPPATRAPSTSDGSVDLSKVTLIVGDQKGGAQALLKAAGSSTTRRTRSSGRSSPPVRRCSRRSTPAPSTSAWSATPRRSSRRPPRASSRWSRPSTYTGKGDAIVVPKDSPIKSVADLKGKKVARRRGQLGQLQPARPARQGRPEVRRRQGAEPPARRRARRVQLRPPRRLGDLGAVHLAGRAGRAGARVLADRQGPRQRLQLPGRLRRRRSTTRPPRPRSKDYLGRIAKAQLWSGDAQGGVGQGLGRADRPHARTSPSPPPSSVRSRSGPDRPGGHRLRAGDGRHVLRQRPAARARSTCADYFTDEFNTDTTERRRRGSDEHASCTGSCPPPATAASLVGAGQGVPHEVRTGLRETRHRTGFREPTIDYLADVARTAEKLGLRGRAHPDRDVLRGRLADHGRAAAGDDPAEVPGRVPTRRDQPGARRADGGGLPADLRRPADAQRRHRRRAGRAGAASATPRPRRERYARTDEFLAVRPRHLARGAVRLRRRALPRPRAPW